MILTMSAYNGIIQVTHDRHIPGDSRVTDDGAGGPGNPNPLVPKGPRELTRSRRIGLSRTVCTVCGAIRDQGLTLHKPGCTVDDDAVKFDTPKWRRETTGPLDRNQTSRDTGWS
jgi:hypothetical protein